MVVGVVFEMISWSPGMGFLSFGSLWDAFVVSLVFATGAMAGDMFGSFIKRRLGLGRGDKAPVLDQYDFVAGALFFGLLFVPWWTLPHFFVGWGLLALGFVIVLTAPLHRCINIIGYWMGKKSVPW
ncbi:MAG: CDP-archaeol synthase [Thermoplasmata archaeon]|nr:CDP-archaeol synthase [Thermoplasmata archaeon]